MKFHLTSLLPRTPGASCLEPGEQRARLGAVDVDLGEQRERDVVGQLAEAGDFRGVARFLPAELVAGKAEHDEAARAEVAIERLSPSYCGVNPHWLAVLTISSALPR